jgi:hypothetical protein
VMIDRGRQPHVKAVRIGKTSAMTIYEETWTEGETKARVNSMIETLNEQMKE